MAGTVVGWSDDIDEVIACDLTAAVAYLTPARGAVVTSVAPVGERDRERGMISFTTSLGFPKKLERIIANPSVAVAYHAREHGFSASPRFVLMQGTASVDLTPSPQRLDALGPQVERFLGQVKRGPLWDPLLREYYRERVVVDITVQRVVAWPDQAAAGTPEIFGAPVPDPPESQAPPKNGTGPRVSVDKAVKQLAVLPHRVLAYRGGDGLPVTVPVTLGGHDSAGIRLVVSPGVLPAGSRRAGLLGHTYQPQLVGLSTRTFTGWLEVSPQGRAVYAPHTSHGFWAPPVKNLLLVGNGLFAKFGMWHARRTEVAAKLREFAPGTAQAPPDP
jgi:hypothetical protein